jgi:hypothetical protein
MTLLELVVGLTVVGLALSAGYAGLASILDHRERVDAAATEELRAASVRRTLAEWLGGARLLVGEAGPTFQGLDGSRRVNIAERTGRSEELPDDELTFLTQAPTPLEGGDVIVRLYVDRDSMTPERGFSAELSTWRGSTGRRVELVPEATGLDLRYFSRVAGERGWLPSWVSSTLLPAGIELTLSAGSADSLPPLLRLPIVVPLETGR